MSKEHTPAAPGHIDWRQWVNERAMDSLDADMEGGDFIRLSEALELAELLVRAERSLYTESLVGVTHWVWKCEWCGAEHTGPTTTHCPCGGKVQDE